MPTYHNKGEYLLVEFREPYRFEDFLSMILEVANLCSKQQLRKVLIDFRETDGEPSTTDRYILGKKIAEVWRYDIQGAGVARKKAINLVIENVAVNRGANVKAFSDLGDAMRWLEVSRSEERSGE